jgi:Domain of unknown function (DUF4386)
MTKSIPEDSSPLFTARMAGALWLAVIVISALDVSTSSIIISGDAATTAHNILASEFRFRLGVLAEFVGGACYLGVTVLLYQLLKPVNRSLALFAACCGAIGISIGAALTVRDLGVVVLLKSAQVAADAGQTQAIALSSIRMFGLGFTVSMVYFGFQCATVGYLIARSGFMPKVIGVLLAIGGSFYVISSFTTFLSAPLGAMLAPVVIPAAFIGEGATTLWLLFKGVNVRKWELRAAALPTPLAAA